MTRRTADRRTLVLLALVAIAGVVAGCQKSLMSPDEPRSQYDRTDAIREKRQPQYVYDEFDRRRPNVQGRLLNAR